MNKTTKTAAKWIGGICLTAVLFWNLAVQIRAQAASGNTFHWWPPETAGYFAAASCLLLLNTGLEALKWQMLAATAFPLTFRQAARSMLIGIAASIITPNRIGEYPGRIMALKQRNSSRLISVSVLGACSQMLALMIAGIGGLVYYCALRPEPLYLAVLAITAAFTALLAMLYFSFERWALRIEHIRALKKLRMWSRMLHRFTLAEQVRILAISLLRFAVYTLQYWLLLRWQGIGLTIGGGLLLCTLFFWAMAVIPSIALAELGIRGTVSLFLFSPFTANVAGIAAATFILWCINLVVPSLAGTALFFRARGVNHSSTRRDIIRKE